MGLMSRILSGESSRGGSSLLKRALELRERVEREAKQNAPVKAPGLVPAARATSVAVLDDVKKKPSHAYSMAA